MLRSHSLAALLTTLFLAGCGSGTTAISAPTTPAPIAPTVIPSSTPIQHIVIIMQENRSFDHLFNGFPGADTVQSGLDRSTVVPLTPISLADPRDIDHSHTGWWISWNQGKMDGFAHDIGHLPYTYVPQKETQPYWDLALRYTVGDRMFQSNTGPSFVAHQYMIAGQSGNASGNPTGGIWGCDAAANARVALVGPNGTELPGVFPCFDYPTMADLLDAKSISWRYYAPASNDSYYILSAFQAIRHIRYGNDWKNNIVTPETSILTDIAAGQLAQVTWGRVQE
ncbi:hypothetical protein BH10ACI4_BH10ACI4_13660 [soil metagenome]